VADLRGLLACDVPFAFDFFGFSATVHSQLVMMPNATPLPQNRVKRRLGSLSVNVFSMANFYDVNQQLLIVDEVQDTIVTFSHPVPVEVTC
jgi:hypothetical protein